MRLFGVLYNDDDMTEAKFLRLQMQLFGFDIAMMPPNDFFKQFVVIDF